MPVTFHQSTLANGLTIVAEVDPEAHTSACGFFVRTGARDEPASIMGVSHFLEHMMFKGTSDLTSDDLNRAFDELGAQNNAYTGHEMTCFHAAALPERLSAAMEMLARMLRPALREDDFATEKGVILEEIAMYKDMPFWVLYEACTEKHFGTHPLGHRVLGTNETITALTAAQMRGYFEKRYSADNTVVALAGRLDFPRAVEELNAWCGGWLRTGAMRDLAVPPVPGGVVDLTDEKVSQAYMMWLAEGPAVDDDRRYAMALLMQVLGASDNSRLHWALVEPGIAEEVQVGYDPGDGHGTTTVFGVGAPERAAEIDALVRRELAGVAESVTEDDLVRLRNKAATAATLGGERPADRMQRLGRLWTALGRYTPLEEELAKILRVTRADVIAVGRDFPLTPRTWGRLLPANAT